MSTMAKEIDGMTTEVSIQQFADSILVLVTQVGKIQASLPATVPLLPIPPPDSAQPNAQRLPPVPTAIQLINLLGHAPSDHLRTLHNLYASQIASILWYLEADGPVSQRTRRNVVVGIALRKSESVVNSTGPSGIERNLFTAVMVMVEELWAKVQG
uniref:Proteasome assembly chaperone 3 n=1 Tax=Moniliophthora roreri TaxID=221103 RepID=A0A0W0FLK6_MONRR